LDSTPEGTRGDGRAATGHDIVYIPPGFKVQGPTPRQRDWIAGLQASDTIVCAACAGVFFLAEAGLLDGRPATTHWGLADEFTARYPRVRLEPEQMLIDGGDYICAGGLTAYFDLALHLVVRFASPELAASCARTLLLDPGRTRQTPYMRLAGAGGTGDDAIDAALIWLDNHHTRPLHVGELAAAVHLGERTLLRRFKKATGRTPSGYLKALRVEHAKRLLESGNDSVDEIVAAVGYSDTPSFFKLFKELTGLSPGSYRSRFGLFTRR
jgi:transcriptional regulator GlxA family with amidase domain